MTAHEKDDVWVAAQTGVNRVTINRIRRGDKKPSWALAAKLKTLTNGKVTPDSYLAPVKSAPAKEARAAR